MYSYYYYPQLFDRRRKCLRGSEHSRWEELSIEYMSLESSDDDGDGTIIVHHLPWCSTSTFDEVLLKKHCFRISYLYVSDRAQ